MKRQNFEVRLNGELVAVKHDWNSARCAARDTVLARMVGRSAEMVESDYVRALGREGYAACNQCWTTSAGETMEITIREVTE